MLVIGSLKDQTMANSIKDELIHRGISVELLHDSKQDMYVLITANEERFLEAQDYYRVKLGFQRPMEIEQEWIKIKALPRGQLTYSIIVFCVVIFLFGYSDNGRALKDLLFLGKNETGFLSEVLKGQVWRLITPIFIHLSVLHILFNMMWFKDLGYLIEYKFGKNFLLLFIGITGIFSNLSQYLASGPAFGGMSGVLYAMLGYVWIFKRMNPDFEYGLPNRDIGLMVGWLFLCMTGLLGPIANLAHASGLFIGMVIALFKSPTKNYKKQILYFVVAVFFIAATVLIEGYKLNWNYYIKYWI